MDHGLRNTSKEKKLDQFQEVLFHVQLNALSQTYLRVAYRVLRPKTNDNVRDRYFYGLATSLSVY